MATWCRQGYHMRMLRRWVIRSLFLLSVLLCMMGWGWSGWYSGKLAFYHAGRCAYLSTGSGAIDIGMGREASATPDGWHGEILALEEVHFWPQGRAKSLFTQMPGYSFLGFSYYHDAPSEADWESSIGIPYWFFILVLAGLLLLTWYKPRPRAALAKLLAALKNRIRVKYPRVVRGLLLVPLVGCVAAWGWSGWYWTELEYRSFEPSYSMGVGARCGAVWLTYHSPSIAWDERYGWVAKNTSNALWSATPRFLPSNEMDPGAWGFLWEWRGGFYAGVPYWILVLLFGAGMFFVRARNPIPNPATAFPVEVGRKR